MITLHRYADVLAALRDPSFSAGTVANPPRADFPLGEIKAALAPMADRLFTGLMARASFDLARDFAEPWSLAAAVLATGAGEDADKLARYAREVFEAAAVGGDAGPATLELARGMPSGNTALRVQTFVALSQTLPCFLAGAWLALLRHPAELDLLRNRPESLPGAIEELLRFAGPAKAQFRTAPGGERVTLLVAQANRDPERFPEPDRLDLSRDAAGHLALGTGRHACMGAALVRMAASVATGSFLERSSNLELAGEVEWRGGFAIGGPSSLPVRVEPRRSKC